MNEQVSDTGSSEPLVSVYVGFVCIFIHLIPLKNSRNKNPYQNQT
jgi:hypothetical protein